MAWIENLGRSVGSSNMTMGGTQKGYGPIIRTYALFLLAKLDYHRLHPDFNATFDYQEYTSLRRVEDPNEGCVNPEAFVVRRRMGRRDRIEAFKVNRRPICSNHETNYELQVPDSTVGYLRRDIVVGSTSSNSRVARESIRSKNSSSLFDLTFAILFGI